MRVGSLFGIVVVGQISNKECWTMEICFAAGPPGNNIAVSQTALRVFSNREPVRAMNGEHSIRNTGQGWFKQAIRVP